MMAIMANIVTVIFVSTFGLCCILLHCEGRPLLKEERKPRQFSFTRRDDGTIVASFSTAHSMNTPFGDNSFGMSQSFEFGPHGASSSGSNSFNSDMMGNKMSFANSQAQSQGLFGMSSANANANSFSNPFLSMANANANSFGSQFGFNNDYG